MVEKYGGEETKEKYTEVKNIQQWLMHGICRG